MNKLIWTLLFIKLVAVTYGQEFHIFKNETIVLNDENDENAENAENDENDENVETLSADLLSSSTVRNDEYISLNRQQHAHNIEDYDMQMKMFKRSYSASLETMIIRKDMLIKIIERTDERLNPLEMLSDLSKRCVNKYRKLIPKISDIKSIVKSCVNSADDQLKGMLSSALSTRNSLDHYYTNKFEKEIKSCKRNYNTLPTNYTDCIKNVVAATNRYTASSQKTFDTQMETALCSFNANIKNALDCGFDAQNSTISLLSVANIQINKCFLGQDECKECAQGYTCPEVHYIKRFEINSNNRTIANPFFGRVSTNKCLMLEIF